MGDEGCGKAVLVGLCTSEEDTVSQTEDMSLCGIDFIAAHSVGIDIETVAEAVAALVGCGHVFPFITCRIEWHLAKAGYS